MKGDLDALIDSNCKPKETSNNDGANMPQNSAPANSNLLPPPTLTTLPQNQAVSAASSPDSGSSSSGSPDSNLCGYVRINSTVGLVQMRAPIAVLNEADDIINRVQDIANRRLMLEARVMAVTKTRGYEQGGSLKFNKGDGFAGSTGSVTSITSALAGKLLSLEESGGFSAIRTQSLDAIVRMLEQYGTTYELMHPMLELMDRQRATLIDGKNERYFIREIETVTADTGQVTRNLKATEKMQFVGLQFAASAQISGDENPHTIALQIPMTSIVKEVALKQVFDNQPVTDQIPVAATRLIDQKVRIRDGEIKVIGGLTKTIAVDKESGQPLLREVPAFGKLLGDENVTFEEVEFVVLLQVRKLS
jgi:type II secretory pathway component GspD/PulD (secretin)